MTAQKSQAAYTSSLLDEETRDAVATHVAKTVQAIIHRDLSPAQQAMLERLINIATVDLVTLMIKDHQYGGSWKKRGGAGAFMVSARKWDRLEQWLEHYDRPYDVFHAWLNDRRQEPMSEDVGDLRRYLALWEQECQRLTSPTPSS